MFPLQTLCIDLIVQKFERYYFAFISSKDKNLQQDFEFLQRRYSNELLRKLYARNKLKEEYFELLINEYVSCFNGEWLNDSSYKNSLKDIFRRLPNLRKIEIRECGDKILANIAKFCLKIIEIDAAHSDVTDSGVRYLCEIKTGVVPCPELKVLKINSSYVTHECLEYLILNIPSLEEIDHPYVPVLLKNIHEKKLRKSENARSYNLVKLNLQYCLYRWLDPFILYDDVLKTCLTVCPKLESLACNILDEEHLKYFTNCHLKKLRLEFMKKDSKINMDNFLKMRVWKLTYLEVTDCTMSISVLGEHSPKLEEFYAIRVNLTDYDDDKKPIFPSLTECHLTDIESSSSKGICLLLSLSPKLEYISLEYCPLSLEMKTQILSWCANPCAKRINLDGISIPLEREFLSDILLNCPSLKKMRLTDNDFDESETVKVSNILGNLAKSLPNEPEIAFIYITDRMI